MTVIEPKFNDYSLDSFGAKMIEYTVGECGLKNGYIFPPAALMFVKLNGNIELRPVTVELDFEGESLHEITLNISNFTAMLHEKAELFLPDGFYYSCVFDKHTPPKQKAPFILRVTYSFLGIMHGELVKKTFSASGKITVQGNYKTPVVYKITPRLATKTVTINGITVKNITGTVVVDGISKTVMQNGTNKFKDTDITSFPVLQPGDNNISITGNADVEVSYYPMYR